MSLFSKIHLKVETGLIDVKPTHTTHVYCVLSLCCSMASVDQVAAIGQVLVDPGLDLTQRFRALFTLRNLGGKSSINIYLT